MDELVGVLTDQLRAVQAQIVGLEQERKRLVSLAQDLKGLRASERRLVAAMSKLQGEKRPPSSRRKSDDIDRKVREFLLAQTGVVTLTQMQRALGIPMSSVRNALRRMPDAICKHDRLWEIAK